MRNGFMFTSSSTILSIAILSSYIWFYVNSTFDHLILQPNGLLPFSPVSLCPFTKWSSANLSCASWSFSISSSDGVVPFQIVLAVGLWTINYVLFNIIIHNYTYTIGTHNQIALRGGEKTYKFQFGSCNRHSAPCVTIFLKFSMPLQYRIIIFLWNCIWFNIFSLHWKIKIRVCQQRHHYFEFAWMPLALSILIFWDNLSNKRALLVTFIVKYETHEKPVCTWFQNISCTFFF